MSEPAPVSVTIEEVFKWLDWFSKQLRAYMGKNAVLVAEEKGGGLSCQKDCARCCYQKIVVTAPEGALIYWHLDKRKLWTPELEAKLLAADKAMTEMTHADYQRGKDKPCVFLDVQEPGLGTCSIYDVRPFGCASLHSFKSPLDCWEVDRTTTFSLAPQGMPEDAIANMLVVDSIFSKDKPGLTMTLPGAVLHAHAICEDLPLPDIQRSYMTDMKEGQQAGEFFDVNVNRLKR